MAILKSEILMPELLNIIPATRGVMEAAKKTLVRLNQQYHLDIGIRFVPVEFLRQHPSLRDSFQGFIIRDDPYNIYVVPDNIFSISEAEKTAKHEFKHAIDLLCDPGVDHDCPVNPSRAVRERRARAFEELPLSRRPSEVLARSAADPSALCPLCEDLKGEARIRKKAFEISRELGAAEVHLLGLEGDFAKRIRGLRKSMEAKMWPAPADTRDHRHHEILARAPVGTIGGDTCPFCAIKHLLHAKTYLIEAASAGFESPISIDDIDEIVEELDQFIIKNKIRPIS